MMSCSRFLLELKTFTFFHSILNNQDKADDHDSKEDIHSKLSNDEMVGCENKEMEDGAISPIIVSTKAKLMRGFVIKNFENFTLLDTSRQDKEDPVKLDETQKVIELNEDNMEEPIEPVENSCGCCALVNIARNIGKKWRLRIL